MKSEKQKMKRAVKKKHLKLHPNSPHKRHMLFGDNAFGNSPEFLWSALSSFTTPRKNVQNQRLETRYTKTPYIVKGGN